ncbi:unnamed protein product [Triticum turgidum subsp. durum]|uniref:Uncharacterized protein n=1 Tax=Triticum turgidum subsp. durum TaxID=4567 RepID=A0A9R1PIX5_TRITD|nr:unnamed protein product [Triticum turgidum subsp. durum]
MADTPTSRMIHPFSNMQGQNPKQFQFQYSDNPQHPCRPYQPSPDTHVVPQHHYSLKSHSSDASYENQDPNDLKQKLKDLEAEMLGPDAEIVNSLESSVAKQLSLEPEKWAQMMDFPRGNLKELLLACARAVEEKNMYAVDVMVPELRKMVSVSGTPLERLGAYMVEGLVARLASSGHSIYKALRCKEPKSSDLLSYMHFLYEACPYFKFGYMITGLDDSVSAYARGGGLDLVGRRLSHIAGLCKVPFEFHSVAMAGEEVEEGHLGVIPGEALASLRPKVLTLVEQESNTNTAPFPQRFAETLEYYTAIFESIDLTLPRDDKERVNMEQHCLAREVVNLIACEGAERVERHEVFGKWKARLTMAGFRPSPLSSLVNATISTLLQSYSENYKLAERDGALYLGWKNKPLVVSSAWH